MHTNDLLFPPRLIKRLVPGLISADDSALGVRCLSELSLAPDDERRDSLAYAGAPSSAVYALRLLAQRELDRRAAVADVAPPQRFIQLLGAHDALAAVTAQAPADARVRTPHHIQLVVARPARDQPAAAARRRRRRSRRRRR